VLKLWVCTSSTIKMYLKVRQDYLHTPPGQESKLEVLEQLQTLKGLSRAFYEIGHYDAAIGSGNEAVGMIRDEPGIHKYVALAQKAKGDIDAAKTTISQAILYEQDWHFENTKQNKQILRQLHHCEEQLDSASRGETESETCEGALHT